VKQIKPYLFWYITGAIVLIELGFLIFWGQYDDNGHTPEQVKQALDTEFKNLEDLHNRAKFGDPQGRFDPEVPLDIQNLTKKYLITERWKTVLVPLVKKYNEQLDLIHSDLVTRSADLHKAIIDNEDPSTWYTAYEGKTRELLLALRNAGGLALPEDAPANLDLEGDEKVRSMVGLFTKGGNVPQAPEHPLLTTRFRIVEKLSEVIIATKGKMLGNPVMEKSVPPAPEQSGAAAVSLQWRSRDTNRDDSSGVVAYNLILTLQGAGAALIATEAAIERITSPVMVVLGASLSEHAAWKPGERKSKEIDPMTCVMTISVLDYSIAARQAPAAPVAPAGPPQRPPPVRPSGPPGSPTGQPPKTEDQ
jgi:hypothetical protein